MQDEDADVAVTERSLCASYTMVFPQKAISDSPVACTQTTQELTWKPLLQIPRKRKPPP